MASSLGQCIKWRETNFGGSVRRYFAKCVWDVHCQRSRFCCLAKLCKCRILDKSTASLKLWWKGASLQEHSASLTGTCFSLHLQLKNVCLASWAVRIWKLMDLCTSKSNQIWNAGSPSWELSWNLYNEYEYERLYYAIFINQQWLNDKHGSVSATQRQSKRLHFRLAFFDFLAM